MTPRRRSGDDASLLLKYWPVITFLIGLALTGLIAFIHLEDDNRAMRGRMDFHWGQEW